MIDNVGIFVSARSQSVKAFYNNLIKQCFGSDKRGNIVPVQGN